jgi:LmbE family N-acetylglucosaminyl deacetylase
MEDLKQMNLIISATAWLGGFIGLFAGRRFYPVWLGFVTFLFVTRIFDLALFHSSDLIRVGVSLAVAIVVTGVVIAYSSRVVKIIPALGGFLVSASIAERMLELIHPEAGKFLVAGTLIAGGLLGLVLFLRLLNFDDSLILLSAVWGAGMISLLLIDILDIVLISLSGALGVVFAGILDLTLLIQSLLWIALALLGIFVQRKIGYEPLPLESQDTEAVRGPSRRRVWVVGMLVVVLLIGLVGAGVIAGNKNLRKNVQTSITNLEHSLGLEAEAPGDAPWRWAASLVRPAVNLEEDDRILVLVPHPDDDILSTAGTIQQALAKNIPVKVVIMTVGDYNETSFALYRKEITLDPVEALRLGETRREEALNAQGILGVAPEQVVFLGYPDGGGLEIFEHRWDENDPYQALLSQQDSVPYTFAQNPGAAFIGQNIVADIQQIVEDYQPTKIFTSHPGDLHPDHQTVPLYLQIALWNIEDEIQPDVFHFITHYGRWPQPRGYQPDHPLDPPAQYDVNNRWSILPITEEQREKKLQALQAHKTQWGSGQAYLESIVRANELFDTLDEIPISAGEEVEILPAETSFQGQALHLHDEEHQEAFAEAEVRTVKLENGDLVFTVELEEPLAEDVVAKIWMMGYRSDTAFQDMPKLFVEISSDEVQIFDGNMELPPGSVFVTESPTRIELRVPLTLLGEPDRILMSVQTHFGEVPLDNVPWVYLKIE